MNPSGSVTTVEIYEIVAPRTISAHQRRCADLPPTWARVRVSFCAICGSDVANFDGRRRVDFPRSIGHEFVGVVAEVGSAVRDVQVGDTVTSDLNYRCDACPQCRGGRSHLCESGQSGQFSNRAFSRSLDIDATYLSVVSSPAVAHLALSEPLSCVLHCIQWSTPAKGESVLVVGGGGLGLCMAFALSTEPEPVPHLVLEVAAERRDRWRSASLEYTEVKAEVTGDFDVVFDLSGTVDGLRTATQHVRAGGRLCTMSHLEPHQNTSFLVPALTRRDVSFKQSYLNGSRSNVDEAARRLTGSWSERWSRLVEVVPLERLQAHFDHQAKTPAAKTIVSAND